MSTVKRTTAVGVFVDRTHAEMAVDELKRQGFGADQIGFIVPNGAEKIEPPLVETETKALEGAVVGAGAGVVLGTLTGVALSMAALPGLGAALVGGLLVGGMASGGLVGALIGLNIPEEEAHHYEREFHSGRTLVTVRAGERYEEAAAILSQAAERPEPLGPRLRGARLSGEANAHPSGGGAFVPRP